MLRVSKPVGEPETRYLYFDISPEFMTSTHDSGIPAVLKRVIDDDAHVARRRISDVRNTAPWTRSGGFEVCLQCAPVLPSAPHANPDAPVVIQVVPDPPDFRCPLELSGVDTHGANPA